MSCKQKMQCQEYEKKERRAARAAGRVRWFSEQKGEQKTNFTYMFFANCINQHPLSKKL